MTTIFFSKDKKIKRIAIRVMNLEAARIRFWVTLSLSLPSSLLKLPNESGNGRRISPVGSCPGFCTGGPEFDV